MKSFHGVSQSEKAYIIITTINTIPTHYFCSKLDSILVLSLSSLFLPLLLQQQLPATERLGVRIQTQHHVQIPQWVLLLRETLSLWSAHTKNNLLSTISINVRDFHSLDRTDDLLDLI